MPFNWKPSPQLPQPVPPIVIPSTAVTYKVDQVANTVNWGGTLLYNTAPAVYDVIYPSNTSYMINVSTNGFATMDYVNAAIANVNVSGGMDWSLINAKGDLIAGLSDNTPGIRTIGLNHAILTANNRQATGMFWNASKATKFGISTELSLAATNNWTVSHSITTSNNSNWVRSQYAYKNMIWSDELHMFLAMAAGPAPVTAGQAGTINYAVSYDGYSWQGFSLAGQQYLGPPIWVKELKQFIAIANSKSILTSNNGLDWPLLSHLPIPGSTSGLTYRALTWNPDNRTLMASGYYGSGPNAICAISNDNGATWTGHNPVTANVVYGVSIGGTVSMIFYTAYSEQLQRHVAVTYNTDWANASMMIYSDDNGNTWSYSNSANVIVGDYFRVRDLIWVQELGKYVALAERNDFSELDTFTAASVLLSDDGVDWEYIKFPSYYDGGDWPHSQNTVHVGLSWAPELGRLVAYGQGEYYWYGPANTATTTRVSITTSPDGYNWTPQEVPSFTDYSGSNYYIYPVDIYHMAWSPALGMFVGLTYGISDYGSNSISFIYSDAVGIWKPTQIQYLTSNVVFARANSATQFAFRNVEVSGQSTVVADSNADTLTLVAGSGMTITTNAVTDTITFSSSGGSSGNSFVTINVAGQTDVVADSNNDTLYIAPGNGIGITTNSVTDTITIFAATNNTAPINYDSLTATISHANSGATTGTYGNATHVATVTVDAKGHITSVSNTLISVSATDQFARDQANGAFNKANAAVANSGVGSNGQLLIGNTVSGGFDLRTLTQGAGTLITNGQGSITIAANVTSVAGMTGAVSLVTDNVPETTTNLYFTAARVRANISNTAPINYNSTTGVISHADSGVGATGYGDAATIPVFVVNATGHVTSVTNTAIAISASQITSGTLAVARGGTANGTAPANGAIPIGNTVSGGYDINQLTAGPNIIITNDKGSITIEASSGAATDQFARDRANGAYTHANSAYDKANGAIYTAAQIRANISNTAPINFDQSTGIISIAPASQNGQLLISNTISGSYDRNTLTAGYAIAISNTPGTITVDFTGDPFARAQANAAFNKANAATPNTSTANGQLMIGNTVSGGFDLNTLTQGTGIVITNGQGTITIAATGGSAIDQFARDTANGAFAHANGAFSHANAAFNKANAATPNTSTANGQLMIGNTVSGGFDLNTLTQGAGILITNGQGTITVAADVTSVAGKVGAVSLVTDDVPETTTNLYFTAARVRANISNTAPINYNSTTGVVSHADSGVGASGYGSSTQVPVLVVNATGHVTGVTNTTIRTSKSLAVFTPNVSDNITCFFTSIAMTFTQCISVVQGTTPNVTYRLTYANTRATGTAGTAITGDIVCANTTNGVFTTSFTNATVPANNYVVLQFPVVSGTVNEFALTMEF